MNGWVGAVLAYVVPALIALGGTVFVARRTGRSAEKAAETTADVAKEANAVDGFDKLVKALQADIKSIRLQNTGLAARLGELEHEVGVLRDERRENRALIRRLWGRLQVALAELRKAGLPEPPESQHDTERVLAILETES